MTPEPKIMISAEQLKSEYRIEPGQPLPEGWHEDTTVSSIVVGNVYYESTATSCSLASSQAGVDARKAYISDNTGDVFVYVPDDDRYQVLSLEFELDGAARFHGDNYFFGPNQSGNKDVFLRFFATTTRPNKLSFYVALQIVADPHRFDLQVAAAAADMVLWAGESQFQNDAIELLKDLALGDRFPGITTSQRLYATDLCDKNDLFDVPDLAALYFEMASNPEVSGKDRYKAVMSYKKQVPYDSSKKMYHCSYQDVETLVGVLEKQNSGDDFELDFALEVLDLAQDTGQEDRVLAACNSWIDAFQTADQALKICNLWVGREDFDTAVATALEFVQEASSLSLPGKVDLILFVKELNRHNPNFYDADFVDNTDVLLQELIQSYASSTGDVNYEPFNRVFNSDLLGVDQKVELCFLMIDHAKDFNVINEACYYLNRLQDTDKPLVLPSDKVTEFAQKSLELLREKPYCHDYNSFLLVFAANVGDVELHLECLNLLVDKFAMEPIAYFDEVSADDDDSRFGLKVDLAKRYLDQTWWDDADVQSWYDWHKPRSTVEEPAVEPNCQDVEYQ